MEFLKPSLLIEPRAAPSSYVQGTRHERSPTASYSHISSFRSLLLNMQIYSPSVKATKLSGLETSQSHPVFSDQDKIEGKVVLDPTLSQNGYLTISLEGAFEYSSSKDNSDEYSYIPAAGKHRHIFLSSSATTLISPVPDSRSTIREVLSVRRRPSASSLRNAALRSCEFSFELPQGSRTGEEMPPSFSSKTSTGNSGRQSRVEEFEVAYRITAVWEASDGSQPKDILEAPVLFQPDTDFQSCDGFAIEPGAWLEMPLIAERPIPLSCAVTLPRSRSFSRCDSVPYFVVFSANTRSPRLVQEVAADATITVSLIRKIIIAPQLELHLPATPGAPPSSDESDSQTSTLGPYSRLLRRSVQRCTLSHTRDESLPTNNVPPEYPQKAFSVLRTLETQIFIGFPKRPRPQDASQTLPDRLYKGKLQLSKGMLPSVDWPGISVKYYIDVSVLVGQDDVRARVPIKIY